MSLIGKKVPEFKAQAFKKGEKDFITVQIKIYKENGQYSFSIQQTLHLYVQLN